MLGRSGVAGKCFGGSQDLHEADMTLVVIFAYHERVRASLVPILTALASIA